MLTCPACGTENPEHARFCLACGAALAEAVPAGEERKVVSVLFVDLVGFTDRSDRADPEDVRATLRPYHERVKADIERFGGTVEKFIGDAVMAVFGAPVAHEDDAERAVRSALRILETIDELREEGLALSVRAAVTSGEAVVALGARPERGEGIVAGDVVNTAARLQSSAAPGTVIVDEVTMRSAESAIAFEPLEPVVAKGKGAEIPVWRATGTWSRVGEPEAAARTPFVGREHERALLLETFLRVERESTLQLVTVVGEPGVGKSRLTTELRAALDDRAELVTWRHGRCLPYGEGITFWALGEIVKAEAGVLESDDREEAEAKLEHAVAALFGDESEREWVGSRLSPLVGASADGGGAIGRDEAFAAWRRFLEAMAARHPFVLVVEDLHWADGALLDFLEHLLDWAAPVPLLVLATARPELYDRRPGWSGGKRNATTISLAPLSSDDTARLLQGLLERALLPAEQQASILERAGGNPLYTEQFARMLLERGNGGDLPLPESVQALIASRLDTLPAETKAVLHDASVVGRTFWAGAVAAVGGREPGAVVEAIRELIRREFVRPTRVSSVKGEDEFSIWHALVRDVAYLQIPRARRAEKHVAAATWVESTAQERVGDQAEILVHHYEQALELSRAAGDEPAGIREALARALVLAGDRAMLLDVAAAEASYRRALELAGESPERAPTLVKLGDAMQEQGRLQDAEATLEEAIAVLRSAGADRTAASASLVLSRVLWRHGHTRRARELVFEAIPVLERDPGPELFRAYERAAAASAFAGRATDAIAWADKAIELAARLDIEDLVRVLQMRGIARVDLSELAGIDDLQKALELSLRLGLGIETATAHQNLGEIVALHRDLPSGIELVNAGRDFAARRGLRHHVMWSSAARLSYLYDLGEWDELLEDAESVLAWDRDRGRTQIEVMALMYRAPVLVHRGALAEAIRDVAIFLPRAREIEDPQVLSPALTTAAFIAAVDARADEALALAHEYDEIAAERPTWRALNLPSLALVCVRAGDLELGEALVAGTRGATPCPAVQAHVAMAKAILAEGAGETRDAAGLYADAASEARAWGSHLLLAYALLGSARCGGDDEAGREAAAIFERVRADPLPALAA